MKSRLIAFTLAVTFVSQSFAQDVTAPNSDLNPVGHISNTTTDNFSIAPESTNAHTSGSLRHTLRTPEQELACEKALKSVKTKYTAGAIALAMLGGVSAAYSSQKTVTSNYNYHSSSGYSSSGTISTTYNDPIAREQATRSTALAVGALMEGMYPDMWRTGCMDSTAGITYRMKNNTEDLSEFFEFSADSRKPKDVRKAERKAKKEAEEAELRAALSSP